MTDRVLLVDKPAGKTSHDVVAAVRRDQPRKTKVGHAGTLDPFATGLLLVLVGRAARLQRYLMALPKTYVAVAKLGWTSDTGDPEGRLEHTGRVPSDPVMAVGQQLQRPPAYSAVKVGGERLHSKARRGEAVEGEPRPVTVHRADRTALEGDRATFEIECSSGTYVRQLVADLGDAYCAELRRTAIGAFSVADAGSEVTPAEALAFMPAIDLDAQRARQASHGVKLAGDAEGPVRLIHDGDLVAVAEPRGHELAPVVVFAP